LRDNGGNVTIGNEIFELCISDYLAAKIAAERPVRNMVLQGDVVENGKFDMAACLEKFARHFYELYSRNDADFLESHDRILFMRPL
jgi:hypothetical protein